MENFVVGNEALTKQRLQATYLCNYFQNNRTYVTTLRQCYRQTDGRTDGQLTVAIPCFAFALEIELHALL